MARESEARGLAHKTRQRTANRPFEDVEGVKNRILAHRNTDVHEQLAERNGTVRSHREKQLREQLPSKARLTVKERKRSQLKSSISLADE